MPFVARPPLTDEQKLQIGNLLEELDFHLWYRRVRVPDARRQFEKQLGYKISVAAFRELFQKHCRWFRTARHRTPLKHAELNSHEWDRLRAAVKSLADDLSGRTLDEAVVIVCTVRPCNKALLSGLTNEYRVWEQK